jgi:DnaJ family protein C protein 2
MSGGPGHATRPHPSAASAAVAPRPTTSACRPTTLPQVFAPAFRRNARWSIDPKVPDVGGPEAPWAEVSAFYDFWFAFRSWREFPHPEEEDVEAAESREHRRWIER